MDAHPNEGLVIGACLDAHLPRQSVGVPGYLTQSYMSSVARLHLEGEAVGVHQHDMCIDVFVISGGKHRQRVTYMVGNR